MFNLFIHLFIYLQKTAYVVEKESRARVQDFDILNPFRITKTAAVAEGIEESTAVNAEPVADEEASACVVAAALDEVAGLKAEVEVDAAAAALEASASHIAAEMNPYCHPSQALNQKKSPVYYCDEGQVAPYLHNYFFFQGVLVKVRNTMICVLLFLCLLMFVFFSFFSFFLSTARKQSEESLLLSF